MAEPIPIDDLADPRVAAYADLRERDLTGRQGRFVVEGEVVLRVALSRSRHRLESVLLSDKRVESVADLLARVPDGVPVYVAPQTVMDRLVGFPIHRGILAIGVQAEPVPVRDLLASLPARAIVVGLVGIANHDNMGGIFPNAAAFGADAVLVDETCCDPLYRKAIRVSVGAALRVPFARARASEIVEALRGGGFEVIALSPSGAQPLSSLAPTGRVALMLGAEGPGLPMEILAAAQTIRIPIASDFDSLNVATTSGIALDHFARQRAAGPAPR